MLSLLDILLLFLEIVSWMIVIRILISWIIPQARGPFVIFLIRATETILAPIRNAIPRASGSMAMIDWSPLIAIILISFLKSALIQLFI